MLAKLCWFVAVLVLCATQASTEDPVANLGDQGIQSRTSRHLGSVEHRVPNRGAATVDVEALHTLHWEEGLTRRKLLQRRADAEDVSDVICSLQSGTINRFLDEEERIWTLNDNDLESLDNNVQAVINCTQAGDVVLFDVSEPIRPASRLIIPWTLTLSATTEEPDDLGDRIFPRMRRKTEFRCPRDNEGVFFIQSRGVLLANLVFRRCSFDAPNDGGGIVEVRACDEETIRESIQMHHVIFRNNQLNGASNLFMSTPSCSAVEMIDVEFRDNACNGVCGGVLSRDNVLLGVVAEGNSQTLNSTNAHAIFQIPPRSMTSVQAISALGNQGEIFHVEGGSIRVTNSTFAQNNGETSGAEDRLSACVHLVECDAIVQNSIFQENSGAFGPALFAEQSNVSLSRSTFEGNAASQSGGAVYLREASTADVTNCVFNNNTALDSGAAIAVEDSEMTVTGCQLAQGSADDGGFLYGRRSRLNMNSTTLESGSARRGGCLYARSSFVQMVNVSMTSSEANADGGAVRIHQSTAVIRASNFTSNNARNRGGVAYATSSSMTVQNSTLESNTAVTSAGGIYVAGGSLGVLDSTFLNNRADEAAAIALQINSTSSVTNCLFLSNVAESRAGAIIMVTANASISQAQFIDNEAGFGAAIYATAASQLNISHSECVNGSSRSGGCLISNEETAVQIHNVTMENNRATENGGAVFLDHADAVITNSSFVSNGAANGGAIFNFRSDLSCSHVIFDRSAARTNGGGIYCERGSAVQITNATFIGNTARFGAATMLFRRVVGTFADVTFTRNTASISGGASYLQESNLDLSGGRFISNIATDGGCFVMFDAFLDIRDSEFINGSSTETGGFVFALEGSNVVVHDSTMARGRSRFGGAVALQSASFEAHGVRIYQCKSNADGGVVFGSGNAMLLCDHCTLENNNARGLGGAIAFQSNQTQLIAIQLNNSTLQDNRADYGGALHFVSEHDNVNCSRPGAECAYAAISGSVFRRNRALFGGGAIFTNDVNALRLSCGPVVAISHEASINREQLESMEILNMIERLCPTWTGNHAVVYGESVASYAAAIKKTIIDRGHEEVIGPGTRYVVRNHPSGTPLPTLALQVCDELKQGPAVGVRNVTTEATMTSPDGLFNGALTVPLIGGDGNMTAVARLVSPGIYDVHVDFSEDELETFRMRVQIRGCMIGEEVATDGSVCTRCDGASYNFQPEQNTGCLPCPDDGNCFDSFIRPRKGHWHQFPCSVHIQRCFTRQACDYERRDARLAEMTENEQNCTFDESFIKDYTEEQCKKGHKGPLCGSCEEHYSKTQSLGCTECASNFVNVVLCVMFSLMLLGLAAFTIRSNGMTFVRPPARTTAAVMPVTSSPDPEVRRKRTVTFSMTKIEMQSADYVTPRTEQPASQSHQGSSGAMKREAEFAKWKAMELFKITVNYLQIISLAISVNVDWTTALRTTFSVAEFCGGVTSEATDRSVDCLVSDGYCVPRSIIAIVIDVLVPLGVIGVLAVYWIFISIGKKETLVFYFKRVVLSAVAVLYISYMSLTKTLVHIQNCLQVHDSTSILFDSTSFHWAADTSLMCYEGSHAILAGAVGWPLLVLISFGFPAIMSYLIKKNASEDFKDGWIYDVAGFMYRSYRTECTFWESVIMLRKASLALVVVFAYELGGNLQCVLAVFVLSLALYAQIMCHPFRFAVLNEMEGTSLLISLLTFASSLFFEDERVTTAARIFVSVIIVVCNVWLFSYFILFFFIFTSRYLKAFLVREGVRIDPKGDARHILKVYLCTYVGGSIYQWFAKVFSRTTGNAHSAQS